ncbi:hypothetical protein [Nocardia wallacei]|uniref:hypothetical protein n=1 Tax=Nocardia wallacei TaxID=480035 RepID=UPI002454171C|nr:hypothetical protein [Nocardia wallacei]
MRQVDAGDVEVVPRLHRIFYDKKIAELERRTDRFRNSLEGAGFERLIEEQRQLSQRRLALRLHQRYARREVRLYEPIST